MGRAEMQGGGCCGWRGRMREETPPSSGNRAFDEYRQDTLRRLEEEQRDFAAFLEEDQARIADIIEELGL